MSASTAWYRLRRLFWDAYRAPAIRRGLSDRRTDPRRRLQLRVQPARRHPRLAALDHLGAGGHRRVPGQRLHLLRGRAGGHRPPGSEDGAAAPPVPLRPHQSNRQPHFLLLSYPSRWFYDILRALDYFGSAHVRGAIPACRTRWMSCCKNGARMGPGRYRPNMPAGLAARHGDPRPAQPLEHAPRAAGVEQLDVTGALEAQQPAAGHGHTNRLMRMSRTWPASYRWRGKTVAFGGTRRASNSPKTCHSRTFLLLAITSSTLAACRRR